MAEITTEIIEHFGTLSASGHFEKQVNAVVEQDRAEQNQAARGRAQQDPAGQGRFWRGSKLERSSKNDGKGARA